jgi:hypothetical protein
MQRIAGNAPAGFSHYLACVPAVNTTVASGDSFYIQQHIEGYNIQDLNWGTASAVPVTVSFWVKSNLTGTFGGFLYGSSHSAPFSYTISASATWDYKTITIATPPVGSTWNLNNDYGITIGWNFGSGSTYQATPGTWVSGYNGRSPTGQVNIMASTSNYFHITGVQLEGGSNATPFERRHYATELQLCQRYCEVIRKQDSGNETLIGIGYVYSSPIVFANYPYKAVKRAQPTVSLVGAASSFQALNTSGSWVQSNAVSSTANQNSTRLYMTLTSFTGFTTGQACEVRADNGGGQIWIDAEI